MADENKIFENKNGNRQSLYEEIGKYFLPDGSFSDTAFRETFRESLKLQIETEGLEKATSWLASYLQELIAYLDEKKMYEASFLLLKAASEEAEKGGIKDFNISSKQINTIFSKMKSLPLIKEEKRISSDIVRNKIFNAALSVFSEKGFHRATMDEIAALSDVGKGTVYRYFKNKEELLKNLLTENYNVIINRVSIIFSRDQDIILQIQEMIEFWIHYIDENHIVYRLIQNEAQLLNSVEFPMFYDYLITHLPMFKERVLALNIEKNIKTTSFYSVFYGILGFIDGIVRKWQRQGMNYSLSDEIPIICEVLINGFVGEIKTNRKFYEPAEK